MKQRLNLLREFSIPLLAGVAIALFWANLDPAGYQAFNNTPFLGGLSFHFVSNELFMVFFFGIAAVEITQSCLPGGDLNPVSKAINPLFATLGGVIGPVAVYLCLNAVIGTPELRNGWGIPTATDIALAWLAAAKWTTVSMLRLLNSRSRVTGSHTSPWMKAPQRAKSRCPVARLSSTVVSRPAELSRLAVCAPMYPAPPVTSICPMMRG